MLHIEDSRGRSAAVRVDGTPAGTGDLSLQMSGSEARERVLASAADLALTRQGITLRALVRLTGLEPEAVERCLDVLSERRLLVPVPGVTDQYQFPENRWPVVQSR